MKPQDQRLGSRVWIKHIFRHEAAVAFVAVAGTACSLGNGRRTCTSVADLGKVAVAMVLQEVDLGDWRGFSAKRRVDNSGISWGPRLTILTDGIEREVHDP